MNTLTPPPLTPKIKVHLDLTVGEKQAMERLAQSGYSVEDRTQVSVIRKMLRKAWEEHFPGEEFPQG